MRIAHIITRMIIGGAQENTLYNCQDLIQEFQDEVVLITGPTQGPEGRLLEQGRAEGVPVQAVEPLRRAIHPLHDIQAYRQLRKTLRDFKPQVVHTHSAKGGFLGRLAAWRERVPAVIHTVHGAPFHPYQNVLARNLFIRLERYAARRCHHMISVADAMTDLMVAAGVAPREKFTTIYSGMDVEPFIASHQHRTRARQQLGLTDQDIVFGKIARLFKLKGHEYLVAAAEMAVKQNPRCKFLLIGDGLLRSTIEEQIAAAGLQSHFLFTGLLQPEQIPFYLSAMDALVHTSLREGLARTLPQALVSGKPVISYDVDGAREVVLTDETGILLAPRAVSKLSDAILRLAGDPSLRDRLGQGGAERFTEQFRHQNMTRRIRQVYTDHLR